MSRAVALGDVVEIRGGGTPSKSNPAFWNGDIPWVSPKDMKRWEINDAEDKITPDAVKGSATNLVPPNSILIVNRSGILKHTLPVGITRRAVAINQDIKALICNGRAYPDYIAHMLKAAEPIVLKWVRATTADNFSTESLRSLEIPLPPLDDQRRIAAILDKADALRRKRALAIELLDGLTGAIFEEKFGDEIVRQPGRSRVLALGDVAEIISGITKGRKLNGEATREVPYLAVSNVQDKFLDLAVVKTIEATENETRRYRLRKDDLLLTEGGDPDKLGRGTLWNDELEESIHQNHIFRVRVTSGEVLPLYLIWLLGSPYGKAYFLRSAKQTTGIASINKTQLSAFPVIVPSIVAQQGFAKEAHLVRQAIEMQASSKRKVEDLFSSLQYRAFSGQL